MAEPVVTLLGIQALVTDLTKFGNVAQEAKAEYLSILANRFLEKLAKFAPVNTGRYINSWRIVEQSAERVVIGPRDGGGAVGSTTGAIPVQQLAIILEYTGATPHTIRPRNKEALHFKFGGQDIFFTVVQHPGMRPKPHIRPALAELLREAPGLAYATLAGRTIPKRWKAALATKARMAGYTGPIPPKQTGRNRVDTSANIGRGTKANFAPKLSVGLSGKRIRSRGLTRLVGTSESGRKGITKIGGTIRGQGLERFR